jgi:hypothetical protein
MAAVSAAARFREFHMNITWAVLLTLALGLTACVVEPVGGYRDHAWNDGGRGHDRDDRGWHEGHDR